MAERLFFLVRWQQQAVALIGTGVGVGIAIGIGIGTGTGTGIAGLQMGATQVTDGDVRHQEQPHRLHAVFGNPSSHSEVQ